MRTGSEQFAKLTYEVGNPLTGLCPNSNFILLTVPRRYFCCVSLFGLLSLISLLVLRGKKSENIIGLDS